MTEDAAKEADGLQNGGRLVPSHFPVNDAVRMFKRDAVVDEASRTVFAVQNIQLDFEVSVVLNICWSRAQIAFRVKPF